MYENSNYKYDSEYSSPANDNQFLHTSQLGLDTREYNFNNNLDDKS